MSDPICFFNQLTLQWGDDPLWSGLSSSLPAGVTALVGPNGHGKSALLEVLAGQCAPTHGQVTWSVPFYHQTQLDPLTGPRVADALGVASLFDAFSRLEQGDAEPSDQSPQALNRRLMQALALARADERKRFLLNPGTSAEKPTASPVLSRAPGR